jgi:uncharacterized protein YjbJ (UPF0337 family)
MRRGRFLDDRKWYGLSFQHPNGFIEEVLMDKDRIEGNWKQVKGTIKEKWGKLTDDDLTVIEGNREQLAGKIQERYGIAKDEAKKQVDEWQRTHQSEATVAERDRNRKAS